MIRALRSYPEFREIPVILMSGTEQIPLIPAAAFLRKPFAMPVLLGLLECIGKAHGRLNHVLPRPDG
jgi:CheY-like chemotaxis protein